MAVTEIDQAVALIVIDLQKGIVSLPTARPTGPVVQNARALADVFRRHDLPVVLVTVDAVPPGRTERPSNVRALPEGWTDLVLDLDQQPGDHRITKRTWGAFTNTSLEVDLKRHGVTQVVIVGIATSIGVESTARHARELGFNVTLATDAMTDVSSEAHDNSVTRIFPRLGETGTTREIIALIETTRT